MEIDLTYFNNLPLKHRELIRTLKERYEIFGRGSSRTVFVLNDDFVLKAAHNKKGIIQNKFESELYANFANDPVLAKVMYCRSDGRLLIQERALIGSVNRIMYETTGHQAEAIFKKIRNIKFTDQVESFLSSIKKMVENYDLDSYDISSFSSWGVIKSRPVLVDYGLSKSIARSHYGCGY